MNLSGVLSLRLDALLLEADTDSPPQLLSYRRYLQDNHDRLTESLRVELDMAPK
jgi:hypothetical protein